MRRQLRVKGGIMNATNRSIGGGGYTGTPMGNRTGFNIIKKIGDRVRKLIPNELASVASKAAPFVAMLPGYGPLAAGVMRGVGRFDKRGSISDALKQGIGTYAGGKLFGKGMEKFAGRPSDGSAIKSLKELPSKFMKKGSDLLKAPSTAKDVLLNQAIIGGTVTLGSLILVGIIDEPEQQPGEDIKTFMLRRKESVSSQLKTYLSNTNPTLSDEQIDNLVAQNMTEYNRYESNKGGRVGYQTGGISMANTLAQNIAINKAQALKNQGVLQAARNKMPTGLYNNLMNRVGNRAAQETLNQNTGGARGSAAIVTGPPTQDDISAAINANRNVNRIQTGPRPGELDPLGLPMTSMMLPNMADGSMRSLAEQDAIRNRVLAAQEANKPTYQERLMGESWETLSDNDQYMIAQEYPGETPPRRNPNFVPNMNQGGRVGLAEGSDDMILPMKKPQVERFLTREEAEARNPAMFVDTTTSNPIPDNAAELEIAEVAKIMIGPGRSGIGEPEDGTMKGYQFFRTQYLPKKIKEISENYGLTRLEILQMLKQEMMKYSKPKKEMMNKGGLMRLNYMIGGEAKQMEAGAPPIMYSGNMDPNAQAGLPTVPGPMQMAPDGPEFDMRENGGFQPLGRQEGKDDVPAMLAKNEFVMTADAVRAAGGGSIQKGAQRMYDTMKKLESRVS